VPLTLFWQRQVPIEADYSVFAHLLDKNGQLVAPDRFHAGGRLPADECWGDNELIVDRHGLLLPDALPAGDYELRVGIYLPATGQRVTVLGANGEVLGDSISLGRVKVASP